MIREPFETMTDVIDVKQIAQALHLSRAGAYNLMPPSFTTLLISGHKLAMKLVLIRWLKSRTQANVNDTTR